MSFNAGGTFGKENQNYKPKCFYLITLIKAKNPERAKVLLEQYQNLPVEKSFEFYQALLAEYQGKAPAPSSETTKEKSTPKVKPSAPVKKKEETKKAEKKSSTEKKPEKEEKKEKAPAAKKVTKKVAKKVTKKVTKKTSKK